jgi:PHD/YefM family antitoxin component YafN of YafNO toxin-antitoxin module
MRTSKNKQQFVVDSQGHKTAVILPLEEYEQLLEDLHDLAVIAERRDEGTLTLDEVKKRLQADGLL